VLVRVQQIVHRDAFSNAGSIFVFTLDVLMKRLLPTHTACPVDAVRLISVPRCYQRFVSLYLLYTPLPFRRRGGGDGPWVRGISQSQPPPWDDPPAADARLPVACEAKDVGRARFFRLVGGRGGAWEPKKASSPASGPAAPIGGRGGEGQQAHEGRRGGGVGKRRGLLRGSIQGSGGVGGVRYSR